MTQHAGPDPVAGRRRPLVAALLLLILAPWVGEFLLGNLSAELLPAIVFLMPLYGFGALLIRETARRLDKGFGTILCFGAAYGVLEAGLFDQSLFNPGFGDLAMLRTAHIPALGISAYSALAFVGGHAIWSIALPIAVTERLAAPREPAGPWLPWWALGPVAIVYLLGGRLIFQDVLSTEGFTASPAQRIGALVAAAAFVGLGLIWPAPRRRPGSVPGPWIVALTAFVVAATFAAAPESWAGVALKVAAATLGGSLLFAATRREGWGPAHDLAVIAALLAVYALLGFALTFLLRQGAAISLVGNAIFAAVAGGLVLLMAFRSERRVAPAPQR